jgi:hypothetical protein
MYNEPKPTADDLPSSKQLVRSTLIAAGVAAVLLVTVVMPAEYGVDPTGVGAFIGLTQMGEIKSQLGDEAETDAHEQSAPDERSDLLQELFGLFAISAHAQEAGAWRDEFSFTLAPGEGTEWKLVMEAGATADYAWSAEGGVVNYDLHGDGGGRSISYEKGRGKPSADGVVTAAFAGNHGWFWRNRDRRDVTVTVRVRGDYSALKRPD